MSSAASINLLLAKPESTSASATSSPAADSAVVDASDLLMSDELKHLYFLYQAYVTN